jgi:hypothetical protein
MGGGFLGLDRSQKNMNTDCSTEALCFAIYFATIVSMSDEEVSLARFNEY